MWGSVSYIYACKITITLYLMVNTVQFKSENDNREHAHASMVDAF